MLLRHLVTQFLQQQAHAKFAEAMRKGPTADAKSPSKTNAAPHATPLLVDGLILYPSEVDAGGVLDQTKEKQVTYCESFKEQLGVFGPCRVALLEVGDGPKAGIVTAEALKLIRPLWVISLGFASGLAPNVRRGQIVMASRIVNEQGTALRAGIPVAAGEPPQPGLHQGDLLTVNRIPESAKEKQTLAGSGAIAWDMDSHHVAAAVGANSLLISVRIISEAIDDQLPQALKAYREQKSLAGKLGAVTGALLDQPSSIQKMWKLQDDAIKLSDRLAKFLLGVVEQLPRREANTNKSKT